MTTIHTCMVNAIPKKLNLMSWNATGIFSGASYLCDCLHRKQIDVCGVSEHWLREIDLHFLDTLDSDYKCLSVSDKDLRIPNVCTVRKGGVALLWHRRHDSRVAPLFLDDDRIVGMQFEIVYIHSFYHREMKLFLFCGRFGE